MSNLKQDLDRIRERISDPSFLKNEGLCNEVGIHIQDVDHCTVISSHIIDSPILGAITPRELSGGVKVLILMLKDDSFIYNMSNCGDNCIYFEVDAFLPVCDRTSWGTQMGN